MAGDDLRRAVEVLRDLGLSYYEAEAYVVLLSKPSITLRRLSELSGIPYTKVYTVLKKLEEKGWVERISDRPVLYVPRSPGKVLDCIKRDFERKIEDARTILEEIESRSSSDALLSNMVLIRNPKALKLAILSLYRSVNRDLKVFVATPGTSELLSQLRGREGISVRILVRIGLKPPVIAGAVNYEVRRVSSLIPMDIIIADLDRMVFCLGSLLETSRLGVHGVVINDKAVVATTARYFDMLWEHAQPWESFNTAEALE